MPFRPDELSPREALDAMARMRASLDGRDVTVWWSGSVFANVPGEPYQQLFGFEGLNVARAVEVEGGYQLLSRECAFYLHPRSREILQTWHNERNGEDVEVVHVWNDPVNQRWMEHGPYGDFRLPTTMLGDQVCVTMEIPLAYPSPLPVAQFPDNSADDTYRALELFQFFAPADALSGDEPSVPHTLSWMRLSPWLPWMRMGQRPGGLAFHCRGRKLDSYDEVPERTRAYIAATHPEYDSAPQAWSEPNETSWTYFRKIVTEGANA